MKKNHEKLTDAIGLLNQETIHGCITNTSCSGRVTNRKRAVTLLAACMATLLMLGAVIAVPMLREEDPIPPSESNEELTWPSAPESDSLPLTDAGLSYHAAPLVNVQILSVQQAGEEEIPDVEIEVPETDGAGTEVSEIEKPDSSLNEDENVAIMIGEGLVDHDVYVLFYTEEGETVTVTSQNGKIGQGRLPGVNHDHQLVEGKAQWEVLFERYSKYHGYIYGANSAQSLNVDPEFPVITWGGNRYYQEDSLGGRADEDYLDFVIHDENGNITGAGSVYLGNQKQVKNMESRYYDIASITRGTVLGAVRFDQPETVTEAQVDAFISELHKKAEEIRPTLFDNLTMTEKFVVALGDVINTNYAEIDNFGLSYGYAGGDRYRGVDISSSKNTEIGERHYLLLADGTWVEYTEQLYFCVLCGEMADGCHHGGNERFKLVDGRIFDDRDGQLVEATKENLPAVTADEVLAAQIPEGSPMKDAILGAYADLADMSGGSLLPSYVSHRTINYSNPIWNRYAILGICTKGQTKDEPATRYFITENGECFEILDDLYPCAHCGEILESEDAVQTHAGYSDYGVGYLLADGRVVTVENGWSGYTGEEEAYLPEFKYPESE